MKIDLNIAGTPAEVRSQVVEAKKAMLRDDPQDGNIIVSALNDYVGRKLAGAGPDDQIVGRVLVEFSDPKPLGEHLRDFVGQPKNEVQRAQAAAVAGERPAPEGARPVVQRIDGQPMAPGPDGLVHGDVVNLGAPMAAAVPGEPSVAGVSSAPARRAADQSK